MDNTEKKSKPKSKEYPAVSLNDAIAFVEKLKDYPVNKPISYEVAANECNVKSTTNSFKYTISSARQYGLISTAAGKTLTFLEPAKQFLRPTGGADAMLALKMECFAAPKLYNELISEYSGQSIPSVKTLENVLVNHYGILQAVANVAASTFIETAEEVGAIQNGILDLNVDKKIEKDSGDAASGNEEALPSNHKSESPKEELSANAEFAAPLTIPFGDKRKAVLYMPIDASSEDAAYVQDMMMLMFKRVYGVSNAN